MDRDRLASHRLENRLHGLLLISGMLVLLAVLGWAVAGVVGTAILLGFGALVMVLGQRAAPRMMLAMYRARRLAPRDAPELHGLVAELSRRAGLPATPQLFWVPSPIPNAFAVGRRERALVGVTDGLVRSMAPRELAGVLAHEIAHVRHDDLWVMGLADVLSRTTRLLSLLGQVLLLLNLPLVLLGRVVVPWTLVLLLVAAPTVSALLQLALSRTREFDADAEAARLTGDPRGLASALTRLERQARSTLLRVVLPEAGSSEPSLLRTHPTTAERVRRLLALEGIDLPHRPAPPLGSVGLHDAFTAPRRPGWHWLGLYY